MAADQAFARDLGYLDGFFDKLEAHAALLGPNEGARLATLMKAERARWTEIRALIAGKKVAAPDKVQGEGSTSRVDPSRPAMASAPRSPAALTVGSLIGR